MRGKLATVIDRIEHGHHVFPRLLQTRLSEAVRKVSPPSCVTSWSPTTSPIFRLKKGLDHLDCRPRAVPNHHRPLRRGSRRSGSTSTSTSRCCNASAFQSPSARSAIPESRSTTPASSASSRSSCTAVLRSAAGPPKQIHHAVFTTFHLSDSTYGLNQLRYDLRKLKAHGLLQRDGSCYAYRLTPKGVQVALLFLFLSQTALRPARQQPLSPLP